jgi:hypothetical protein
MMSAKGGKLLARAAGFYHPGGVQRITGARGTLLALLFDMQKEKLRIVRGSCIPSRSHQGEREKNEYL